MRHYELRPIPLIIELTNWGMAHREKIMNEKKQKKSYGRDGLK